MKLTQQQLDKLWGEDGPYSQANLIIQTRILDDKVSRVFIEVDVEINPLTYEIIKQNITEFKDDPIINQLIKHAENRGQNLGYVSSAFSKEYYNESVMDEAKASLEYSKKTIIKMHKYVMKFLNIPTKRLTENQKNMDSIQEILEQRKEIEREVAKLLKKVGSDFSLKDVKSVILHEEDTDDMMKVVAMFDCGKTDELSNVLELVTDAWNYFPHKALNGLSPVEMGSKGRG